MNVHNGMAWREFLNDALREYKNSHTEDTRTDWEILESLMAHLADSGIVTQREDGKYIVPPFIGRLQ